MARNAASLRVIIGKQKAEIRALKEKLKKDTGTVHQSSYIKHLLKERETWEAERAILQKMIKSSCFDKQ